MDISSETELTRVDSSDSYRINPADVKIERKHLCRVFVP